MKPVAIDLFCGKGGWTNALLEVGFEVYGFDIEPQPDYRGIFVQCDILALTADDLRQYGASFAACSSSCEEFSVHGMKHFHPNPKYPETGVRLFNHARALLEELNITYIMENVRPAEKFVGKAVNHCGPFYLWGTGVPAIMPREAYRIKKNIQHAAGFSMSMSAEEKRLCRLQDTMLRSGSKSKVRREHTAQAAMIPLPIARAVADLALHCLPQEKKA